MPLGQYDAVLSVYLPELLDACVYETLVAATNARLLQHTMHTTSAQCKHQARYACHEPCLYTLHRVVQTSTS